MIIKHITEQPFVMATGIAALLHSTWSLGTLMAGEQPEAGLTIAFVGWILPAFLIAFALDVGQIATSVEIRRYGLSPVRAVTFATFAIATYYLQWLYIAHHMPSLELSAGISTDAMGTATAWRDAALWILPALLPASTLLYTFSTHTQAHDNDMLTEPTADEPTTNEPTADEVQQAVNFTTYHQGQADGANMPLMLIDNAPIVTVNGKHPQPDS